MGKPEGKRQLGKPGRGWEDINIHFQDMVWKTWTALIWLRIGTRSGLL